MKKGLVWDEERVAMSRFDPLSESYWQTNSKRNQLNQHQAMNWNFIIKTFIIHAASPSANLSSNSVRRLLRIDPFQP